MLMIGHADHDEARPMRQVVMVRAHGVLRSVAARAARANHSVAAQGIGKGKLRARMEVKAVMHAGGKRHGSASDALTANDIAHGSVRIVDIAFHAVEQGIEPLESREVRRDREHELGIDHRKAWKQARIAQTKLLVGLLARKHGARIDLGAGARRRGHAHQRKRIVWNGETLCGTAHGIVPNVTSELVTLDIMPGVGRHHADALAAVHNGAAAQREHEIAVFHTRHPASRVHGVAQGVGLDAVKEDVLYAGAVELSLHARKIAICLNGLAARGNQKGALARQLLVSELIELAWSK